jgi:RNA polymerase sigma factor (TIGR02999 family)
VSTREAADVTALLDAWAGGDQEALDRLIPIVYPELYRIAQKRFKGQQEQNTLQPTALIHEAYIRLAGGRTGRFENRAKFFSLAATIMRNLMVDHARARYAEKRGNGGGVQLEGDIPTRVGDGVDILDLHEALQELAQLDPAQASVVEMRYFAGFSIEETAEALGVSAATVKRDWVVAKTWIRARLDGRGAAHAG